MSTDSGPNAILDPTGRSRFATPENNTVELAARRADLRGVRVGLLENTKHNADLFLDELGRLLLDEHEAAELTRRTKTAFALPVSEAELADVAANCDVVITGVGDCGSCSASAVADGVAFERRGIPAAVICSDAYRVTADAMADHAGMPGYRYVTTPHPVAVLAPEEVRERARQCLKDVVTLITSSGSLPGSTSGSGLPTAPQGTVTQPSHTHPANRTASWNATTAVNSGEAELDSGEAAIEHCYERGWSDGLPLVRVSATLLAEFLAMTGRDPGEVIGRMPQLDRDCTVELAAINAAMAGCRPEYFPVVLAAFEALMRDRTTQGGGWQSTSGPAPLIVVNGPVRTELGFNCAGGVFGPGFRPNATVARAIGLIVRNAFGVLPQVFEQATQGVPGRWSICVAENEEESPWEPLSADGGLPAGTSAVSAMLTRTCEFVDNRHTSDPEQLLADFADTISRSGALIFRDTSCGVVFGPEHAQLLADAGYTKAEVRAWLVEHCGRSTADLRRAGKDGVGENGVRYAAPSPGVDGFQRILPDPHHVPVFVAGARNAAMSMVVRVFGIWSGVSVAVERRSSDGRPGRTAGAAVGAVG